VGDRGSDIDERRANHRRKETVKRDRGEYRREEDREVSSG
jgi:hypothetical protein